MSFDVLFRADASPKIGVGHITRCLALADVIAKFGWRCGFAVMPETLDTIPALEASAHQIIQLDEEDELKGLEKHCSNGVEILIVDHYEWSKKQETPCRKWAKRIVVIDDLANRPHDCDVLLDQAAERGVEDYDDFVPQACKILLGPSYALLRPQFAKNRREAIEKRNKQEQIKRILVTLGGTPSVELMEIVLDALQLAGCKAEVDLVVGLAAKVPDSILDRAEKASFPINILSAVSNISDLMLNADLSIGTVGSTSWERCCLGLPSAVIVTADNQIQNAKSLHKLGAAFLLGKSEELSSADIASTLKGFLLYLEETKAMSEAALKLCDGLGSQRVLLSIFPQEVSSDGQEVSLRLATNDDTNLLFRWQQLPETRRYARNSSCPTANEHAAWMNRVLSSDERFLTIIEHGGVPAGMLRLDQQEEENAREVSIFIAPEKFRLGIGVAALNLARKLLADDSIIAEVLPGNTPSQRLFTKAGYESDDGRHFISRPIRA